MRIAAVCRDGTSNARYRVQLPLRALARRGHRVQWGLDETSDFDVLLLHQSHEEEDLARVQALREQGVAVVWDTDDDISAVPRFSPTYKAFGGRRGLKRRFARTIEIARAASLMTTPSAHLAELYRSEGVERVAVLENHVAQGEPGQPRPRHQGVVIGLTAAWEHNEDLDKLRIPRVLTRLLGEHPGLRVVTVGPDLKLRDPRYLHRGIVPVDQLIAVEREFDIGIAPLTPSRFGLARSNVKVKEYAAAGAMWLASPVGPYVGLGEEQGGLLVGDDDWFSTLDALVVDHRRRAELMERARVWGRTQSVDRAAGRWEAVLRGALAQARAA